MKTLEYRPQTRSVPVSYNLRKVLIDRLWPEEKFEVPVLITRDWIPYFQGLEDAGYSETELILDALETNEGGLIFSLGDK
jgi:hypothetical protein